MKRFAELSNEELLELTNKGELSKLVDLECAYQSIPLLPVLPDKPEKKEFPKDVTYYAVGNFKFMNEVEAVKVIGLLKSCALIDTTGWGSNERVYPMSEYNQPKLEVRSVYSEQLYKSIESDLKAFEEQTRIYNDLTNEYDKIDKQRKEIEDEIFDKVADLQKEEAKKSLYKEMFTRYLELAGNNKQIALNFLDNAYPDAVNYPEIQALATEGGTN